MAININHPDNKITTTSGELIVDDTLNIKDLKVGTVPVIDEQGNWVGPTVSAYSGSRGVTGFTGSRAYTGSRGFTGSRSYTGSRGFTGYAGSRAYTGSRGFIGYTGSRGLDGFIGRDGYTGSKGVIGYTGSRSYTGSRGFTSSRGYTGSRAYTGSRGFMGSRGYNAFVSETPPIAPIYGHIWLNTSDASLNVYYNDGTSSQWVSATGPRGITGYIGSQGVIGYTGSRGFLGSKGYTGSKGFTGSNGFTGSKGFTGFTGSRGFDGTITETSNIAPLNPINGQMWFDTEDGTLKVYYSDGSSSQWIVTSGPIGLSGYTGSRGLQGEFAAIGYTGSQGIIGYTGSRPQISSSDTQIIYNNAGTISGAPQLTYNTATNTTTIGTTIVTNSATFNSSIIEKVFTISGSTPTILASNGTIQLWNLTANSTPTLSLNSGEYITLMISDGTAFTITWSGVTWVGGTTPTLPTTGSAVIELWKVSTITYGAYIGNVA